MNDSLKPDNNKRQFTLRPIYIFIISRSVLLRIINVSDEICRENRNTYFVFSNCFSKIVPFVRKCGIILYSRIEHRWKYGTWTLHAEYLSLKCTHSFCAILIAFPQQITRQLQICLNSNFLLPLFISIHVLFQFYVYWTVHHLDSWIKRDQLDVICFIISLFNALHVSDVNISILRSLRLICWFISWVVLLWFDVC